MLRLKYLPLYKTRLYCICISAYSDCYCSCLATDRAHVGEASCANHDMTSEQETHCRLPLVCVFRSSHWGRVILQTVCVN